MADQKSAARKGAFARRKAAHDPARGAEACRHLTAALADYAGAGLAGYLPIRTEIDPRPAMTAWTGPVGVPVVDGPAQPLRFLRWHAGCDLVEGAFGVMVPDDAAPMIPSVLIVPLAAFDGAGFRLGYGGGFYDRTLAGLRARGPVTAIGFAYAAQEVATLPRDATDAPLDAVVTEQGLRRFTPQDQGSSQ